MPSPVRLAVSAEQYQDLLDDGAAPAPKRGKRAARLQAAPPARSPWKARFVALVWIWALVCTTILITTAAWQALPPKPDRQDAPRVMPGLPVLARGLERVKVWGCVKLGVGDL